MLDTNKILEAALEGVTKYIDQYNAENDAQVNVAMADPGSTDFGAIEIDGGNVHGAWYLELGEL